MTRIDRIGIDLGAASMAGPHAAAAAAAGAGMARVRFALEGRPMPDAAFLDAARRAVADLRAAGLGVLAVLDSDLTVAPEGMGAFEDRPPGPLALAWVDEMAANVAELAACLGDTVLAWEILPAPNRGDPPRIAPGRWAALLVDFAEAIRGVVPAARIIAGGLFTDDADDGVDYLAAAYRAAGTGLWPAAAPPFDAVGLQLYVLADGGPSEDDVAAMLRERVQRLWRVVERFEGTDAARERGLYVTGLAWDADRVGSDVQARNLWTALDTLTSTPIVQGLIWTGLTDASPHAVGATGLYRGASIVPNNRRWAWNAFNDFALYARQISPAPSAADLIGAPETGAPETEPAEPEPMEMGLAAGAMAIAVEPAPGGGSTDDALGATEVLVLPDLPPPAEPEGGMALPAAAALAAAWLEPDQALPVPPEPSEGATRPLVLPPAVAAPPIDGSETIVFRIPDAVEVLRAQGLDGPRLEAVLDAVRLKYGGPEWLRPGEYQVAIRPAEAVPGDATGLTNQQIISALYRAGGGTWELFERSGLSLGDLATRRNQPYDGPPIATLEALTDDERQAIARALGEAGAGGAG